MKRWLLLLSLFPSFLRADVTQRQWIITQDGTTCNTFPYQVIYPNSACTDNGNGTVSINVTGGGGGGGSGGNINVSTFGTVGYYSGVGTTTISGLQPGTSGQVLLTGGLSSTPFWGLPVSTITAASLGALTSNQSITWTGSGDVAGTASGETSLTPTLTAAALQNNITTFGSSITVTNPSGEKVTYGVSVGSMTASSATISGQLTAGTYQGGGLSTCGSSSQAQSWTGGTFGCTTITAAGIGALTGNQTVTLSGDATGSGATAITVSNTALQSHITTFSSSITVTNASGENVTYGVSVGSMTASSATITGGFTAGSEVLNNPLPVTSGGTGLTNPSLVAGTNITSITGTWPNQTINAATQAGGVSLTSTQTWTGQNNYTSSMTVTSTNSVNGLLVTGTALNYGTNNPNGGAFETDCTNQTSQGYCAQFYSFQSTQTALDAVVNIYQANSGYNERALYIQALGQNNSPINGIRMDGYSYITTTYEDTTMNGGGIQGIYQDSVHNNCMRRETRISGSFEDAFIVCHDTTGVSVGVNSDYGVPVSTFEDSGNMSVGSEGTIAPLNGLLVGGNAIFKSNVTDYSTTVSSVAMVVKSTNNLSGFSVSNSSVTAGDFMLTVSSVPTNATIPSIQQLFTVDTYGAITPMAYAKATIATLTPVKTNEIIGCTDCTALVICTSTGTTVGAWSSPVAKTTSCN